MALLAVLGSAETQCRAHASAPSAIGFAERPPTVGPVIQTHQGYMIAYEETIPGTDVRFTMVPVSGGEFLLGSADGEEHRQDDEGPQTPIRVEPLWVGRCEVTWAEYRSYMAMYGPFKKLQQHAANLQSNDGSLGQATEEERRLIAAHGLPNKLGDDLHVDAVTSPTPLYDSSTTYSAGDGPQQPAVTMTPYAARQYSKWLSGITGREYRLPTEGEWECFARAGTTTAWSFGDAEDQLNHYAWTAENSDGETHPVGSKEPNPWGLYDVHGNVAEWTLDEYRRDAYQAVHKRAPPGGALAVLEAVQWPTRVYPRAIRGGSWQDAPGATRSAARRASEEKQWKTSDPNSPKSPWWYTEEPSMGVGMRVVRALAPMGASLRQHVWEIDHEWIGEDVAGRLSEGRGVLGVADLELPAAIEAVERLSDGAAVPQTSKD